MKFPSANGHLFARDWLWLRAHRIEPGRVFPVRSLMVSSEWSARNVARKTVERNIFRRRTEILLAKPQFSGERLIAVSVRAMEVIQQPPALTHHFEQTTPRAVIFQILLQVVSQMVDTLG